jgi:hypothetical protein
MDVTSKLKIDWSINKSWRQVSGFSGPSQSHLIQRQIRVLHGPKSPNTPYNEQNLYNLYCRAFVHAGFSSRMKAHLPRHLLGYKQEKMGCVASLHTRFFLIVRSVDKADTSKLGWVRGATYFDTYAPALPKKVNHFVLLIWHSPLRRQFSERQGSRLKRRMIPYGRGSMSHSNSFSSFAPRLRVSGTRSQVRAITVTAPNSLLIHFTDRANLSGAFNYWQMVIDLRPYAFQVNFEALLRQNVCLTFL